MGDFTDLVVLQRRNRAGLDLKRQRAHSMRIKFFAYEANLISGNMWKNRWVDKDVVAPGWAGSMRWKACGLAGLVAETRFVGS